MERTEVSHLAAFEESFFLVLRLTRGVNLQELSTRFGQDAITQVHAAIAELVETGLMEHQADSIFLTSRGRLLSNEVFERFIAADELIRKMSPSDNNRTLN